MHMQNNISLMIAKKKQIRQNVKLLCKIRKHNPQELLKPYLSILLSRRLVRSGRRDVHISRVIRSLLSLRLPTTSEDTCLYYYKSQMQIFVIKVAILKVVDTPWPLQRYPMKLDKSTYTMIRHLLNCIYDTFNIISLPKLVNYLHVG